MLVRRVADGEHDLNDREEGVAVVVGAEVLARLEPHFVGDRIDAGDARPPVCNAAVAVGRARRHNGLDAAVQFRKHALHVRRRLALDSVEDVARHVVSFHYKRKSGPRERRGDMGLRVRDRDPLAKRSLMEKQCI